MQRFPKINKAAFVLFLLCLMAAPAAAQRTLLEEIPGEALDKNYGPNRRHFFSQYLGIGFGYGESPKNFSDDMSAFNISYGWRYKMKTNRYTALVFDLGYQYQEWRFFANSATPLPSDNFQNLTWRKNKLHLLDGAVNWRIQFFRGNSTGPSLDLGAGAWLMIFATEKFRGKDSTEEQISFNRRGWQADNPVAFYSHVRLHLWAIALSWKQRFSPWLKENDLPPTTIGIELNLN